MISVREILKEKGSCEVFTIDADELVFHAVKEMSDRNVGALVVTKGGMVVGMISERDYARKVVLASRSSRATTVREVMSSRVLFALPENSAEECMALMTEARVRHLPVVDNGRLAGLISTGDVIKATISRQEFIIEQLTRYITDSYSDCPLPARLNTFASLARAA